MYTVRRDRVVRGVFALSILAAHVLLAYLLTLPVRRDTTSISGAGESVLVLLPGDSRESTTPPKQAEPEPDLEQPAVVWVPTPPSVDLSDSPDASDALLQSFADQQASGRRDLPRGLAAEDGIAVIQRVLPQYPIESVRAGEEGSAVLQVLVDESGRASDVRVARSTGFERLDDSAVRAVRQWKFAPSTQGALPVASWGEMELRFELYRFTVSRIVDAPMDLVPRGQILNAASMPPVPGGSGALRQLMNEVRTANADAFDAPWLRDELKRMRAALAGWGEVVNIQYTGAAAGNRWRTYEVRPEFRNVAARETVELRWDVYAVTHDRGVSEWRIAIDRNGAIWCAHAGSVRPGAVVLKVSR